MFSKNDLVWIECLRILIHEKNISIPGIKRLLELEPCWQLRKCSEEIVENCSSAKERKKLLGICSKGL